MGPDVSRLGSASLPMPAAQVWKAIAELVAKGFSALHPSARWAMLIGGALGLVMEWANGRSRGKFPLSAVGIGLATTIQFPVAFSMALGALLFWGLGVRFRLLVSRATGSSSRSGRRSAPGSSPAARWWASPSRCWRRSS